MKKQFTFFTLLIALMTLSSLTFAQGTVKGKLVDKETGESLIGGTIYLEDNSGIGTVSGLDGTFSFSFTGEQIVVFSYVGFIDQVKKLSAVTDLDLGNIRLESSLMGISEISVIANIAIDRQTPVAISTIKPQLIAEKLGGQEYPEILKSSPGIYATKSGGGFGDSRVNVRGFDMKNTAVMINGIPVNDMENGWVYWSNWAGLSEVTRSMQVQRGLGASKLSIGSVGGTINILTKTTDTEKGGVIFTGIGNDGYKKTSFTLSTGLLENGIAITASGARTTGEGWIDATQFESWSYFLNVSKRWEKQSLSFTVFGAPQTHGQNRTKQTIETYNNPNNGIKYNSDWGYKDGQVYNLNTNFYHKPQMSLNHFIQLSEKTKLATSAYMSFGTGGGTGDYGEKKFFEDAYKINGQINFDKITEENIAAGAQGSSSIMRSSRNDHSWYGVLSNLNHKVNDNIELSGGLDLRYYEGRHFREVVDLLGGDFYMDDKNKNNPINIARVGDKINYNNDGQTTWQGLFAQAEYTLDQLSSFLSVSGSNTGYRRIDYFNYLDSDPEQTSEWVNHLGYVVKGGANYNLNTMHNVFVNAGYFERAPFFDAVFYETNTNAINEGVENEKALSFELGYGYRRSTFTGNINGYYTQWKDKFLRKSVDNPDGTTTNANLIGVNALHMGIELDFVWTPIQKLEITGMASLGDWKWQNDLNDVILYDNDLNPTDTINIFMKDLKVGDAAQTTVALGVNYELFKGFKLGLDFNYYDNLYAQFDPTGRTEIVKAGVDAWKIPAYNLLDFNLKYKFEIGGLQSTIYANINNLFDAEYISEASDGSNNDWRSARVFYGIGRTFTTGIKINF
ncbi:MAG: TonB-dependent receptor [Salinivirgaceae bacterium]|nr:TonB-dependent receptor [Salinivirgaceae bacterium]